MASEKMLEVEESQDTPQAITITIVDPSALGNTSLDSSLVASVETQDGPHPGSSIVMVSGDGHDAKNLLQTVTETHMGTEDLPIISNISNTEEDEDEEEETIVHETKLCDGFDGGGEEAESGDPYEVIAPHCLVCNVDLTPTVSDDHVPVFKTQTSTSQRRVAIFLSSLIGQTLTSRKAHSDILCRRCFNLLDRVDSLEVEIKETKEEIVNKYQETVSVYGGRARRRRKPPTAKQRDYVFPKVEPEDEEEQLLDMEVDGNFEPQMDDLMDEEPNLQDDDWEPELKKPRIKKETSDVPETVPIPPKRKRGRPRKDATRPKKVVASTTLRAQASCTTTTEAPDPQDDQLSQNTQKERCRVWPVSSTTEGVTTKEVLDGHPLSPSPTHTQQCPLCFLTCLTISHLKNHFKQIHPDVKRIKCIQCSEVINGNFEVFLSHCKNHHHRDGMTVGGGINTRDCPVCHKQVQASGYSHHLATHKTVPCPKCYRQVVKRNLKRHLNYFHAKKVVYKCDECPAVYHDASHLLSHRKRNHLGQEVRRHLCEVCGKKFIVLSDLRTHMSGVHHNVKKFVCEYCGLSFKVSSSLMYHRRLHTGEKPHTCHVCERGFMKPNSLAKHVRRVHGLEYQGKYRKRIKAPEPSSKAAKNQGHSNSVVSKPVGVVVPPIPPEEVDDPNAISPMMKETVQEEPDDEGLRLVYSLSEQGVVKMVNLDQSAQAIQNLSYFRPGLEERAAARPYEATESLHTMNYYRQDAEEQYTVAALLPPQDTQESSRPYPGTITVTPPEPTQSQ